MVYLLFILIVMSCGFFSSRVRKIKLGLAQTLMFGFSYGLTAVILVAGYLYTRNSALLGLNDADQDIDQAILWWLICFPVVTTIYFLIDYARKKS